MPNGKPGDHPINDICNHGLDVFSPKADQLIRDIDRLIPRKRMWDLFPWFDPPPLPELEAALQAKLDDLRRKSAPHELESPNHDSQ